MSESDSENSAIAIARPKKKKKNIEEESGSESEQILPSIGIDETIFIFDDESKSNIKKFVPVKQVEDI